MKAILRIVLFFFIFTVVTVITGYITFGLLTTSKSITVPDLRGRSLLDANGILSGVKLYLKVEGETYDNVIPNGQISKQNIPAGNKIKEGRTISVVMSKGKRSQMAGDLRGQPVEKTQDMVAVNKQDVAKVIEVHSDTVEEGKVIAQWPSPEDKGGGELSVVMSKGPYVSPLYCPDFMGQDVEQAQELAKSLGLEVNVTGTGVRINAQLPAPNTVIKKGSTVELKATFPDE
ncbi:MAG: PASTA domain-containing protein [Nitrospirae bacterium]|uniref:PASTA domain-containing protein n=1 Tax=Candidatus Magnetobacterium casense TaxID=1455061 RepID=UPI00058FA847|nr:PASTA domain-containing protein [Candidatus Magnetobacterium casensis]MBF0337336.1 PASTA domain-containing protein [Nitrospirota bacterium]